MILGAVSAVHVEFALAAPARAHLRQARRQTRLFALPALVALLPAIFLVGRLVPALPGFELVAVCFAIGQVANVWFGPFPQSFSFGAAVLSKSWCLTPGLSFLRSCCPTHRVRWARGGWSGAFLVRWHFLSKDPKPPSHLLQHKVPIGGFIVIKRRLSQRLVSPRRFERAAATQLPASAYAGRGSVHRSASGCCEWCP